MRYDDVQSHLAAAGGSMDKAAVPLGMYLALCVNVGLTGAELDESSQTAVLRVRYREITGAELLISGCAGVLDARWFNEQGRDFCERYYASFLDDFRAVFGDDLYEVRDDWDHYDQLAPLLTERLYGKPRRSKPWWKLWR